MCFDDRPFMRRAAKVGLAKLTVVDQNWDT